jgi:hypothetical protein
LTIPRNARWDIRAATRAIKVEEEVAVEETMTITDSDRRISIMEVVVMGEVVMVLLLDPMVTTITRRLLHEATTDLLEDMALRHTDIMTLRAAEMDIINADIARDGIRDSDSRIIRSKGRGRGNLNITISNGDTRPITDRDTKTVNTMAVIRSNTITIRDTTTGATTIGDIMAAATAAVTAGVDKRALEPFWTVADCEGTRST